MNALLDIALLAFLVLVAIAAIRLTDLFAVVMLFGIYSFLMAGLFLVLDAVDVAFTEAAVGAGITTVLMLATLRRTGRFEPRPRRNRAPALIAVAITGAALVYGTLDAPPLGAADAPAHRHVAPRYIAESRNEIGVPNMVTAVLASYRGYDTLGETLVIFTAGLAVLMLAGSGEPPEPRPTRIGLGDQLVLRVVVKALLPFMLLFALYVQFHGDYGAGGGFQAGVIFATGLILYDLVFGAESATRVMPARWLPRLAALGVLLYAVVGVVGIFQGRAFLDYRALAADPIAGQHLGIMLIELGVGMTVFSTLLSIFYALSHRRPSP